MKTTSYFSLAAIILYWVYSFFMRKTGELPKDFFDLVLIIVQVKVIHFALVTILLRSESEGFGHLGFRRQDLLKQVLRGMLYGMIVFVIGNILINSIVLNSLNPGSADGVKMGSYFTDWKKVGMFILIGIVGGGFVEEYERIFVLTRFQNWLGKAGLVMALVIGSVEFGLAHYYQGLNSAITAGFSGLLFGLVYIRKGSAIEAVSCHAFYDTIGIVIGYFLSLSA